MTEPKRKTHEQPKAKVESMQFSGLDSIGSELTPEWQAEFMMGIRMEKARIPERFLAKSFENFQISRSVKRKEVVEQAQAYVNSFNPKDREVTTNGLLLHGTVGCGKTHIAVAILQAVIRKGYSGLYYNMPDLLSDIRATFEDNSLLSESDLLQEVNEPDLLLLDDLGAETTKEWVNDRLYLLINRRYESCKPILVTTNLTIDELSKKLGERTVSRLCEMCHSFASFPDEDYRKKHMR